MPGQSGRFSTIVKAKISKLLDRAEDPQETLDYSYEKQLQLLQNVKRGVADAARRLYTERAALRYDGLSRQVRMADVIELTHPQPRDDRQSGAIVCRERAAAPIDDPQAVA